MGRRKGGPGAGACRSQSFCAGVRTRAVFTSMCWSESERGWFFQPGEEERLEAGPAEAVIPRLCLPPIPRMPQWEMGCGFPSLALLFGWNFRRKIHKLRKKGISALFCNLILPLKTLCSAPLLPSLVRDGVAPGTEPVGSRYSCVADRASGKGEAWSRRGAGELS